MNKKELNSTMKSILRYGIKMETRGQVEDDDYLLELSMFINQSHSYNALHEPNQDRILVETVYFNPISYIEISNGTLSFIPVTDEGFFPVMMKVLEFIAERSKKEEDERIKKRREEKVSDDFFDWV